MRDRIKQIMDSEHMTPSAFADKLHIGRAVMSHLLNGRNNPSLDVVTRILAEIDYIDSNWLLMGEGDMYKKGTSRNPHAYVSSNLDQEDKLQDTSSSKDLFSQNSDYLTASQEEYKSVKQEPKPIQNLKNTDIGSDEIKYGKEIIVEKPQSRDEIIDNQEDKAMRMTSQKKVNKIIVYYNDNTFEIFEVNNAPF